MTTNQIAYWNLVENKRHNVEQEAAAHKQAQAALSQASAAHKSINANMRIAGIQADVNRSNSTKKLVGDIIGSTLGATGKVAQASIAKSGGLKQATGNSISKSVSGDKVSITNNASGYTIQIK